MEVLTAPYIEDSGDGIVALDPHALKKLFTTTSSLLQVSRAGRFVSCTPPPQLRAVLFFVECWSVPALPP